MSAVLIAFVGVIIVCTFLPIMLPHGTYTPRHDSTRALAASAITRGSINYSANPYRIGSYVYVMENTSPSDLDWNGTFLGMRDGMALVRDADSLVVTHVNRDQLYGAQR